MGAPRFNAASLSHKEDHLILPEEIIVNETLNGRFEPHSQADVEARAVDMLVNGQLAPVGIRKSHADSGKPMLVYGFLRCKAAIWLNKVVLPAGGVEHNGTYIEMTNPFKLWCAAIEGNDLDSIKRNIIENLSRKGTTMMDMAKNQQMLRMQNMTDQEIATLYGSSVQAVIRNAKLLSLSREIQTMIHRGFISAEAGLALLEVKQEDQEQIIRETIEEAQKVGQIFEHSEQEWLAHMPGSETNHPKFGQRTSAPAPTSVSDKPSSKKSSSKKQSVLPTRAIKGKVRNIKQSAGQKGSGIGIADVRAFYSEFIGPDASDDVTPEMKEHARKVLEWLGGKVGPMAVKKSYQRLQGLLKV